MSDLLRPVAPSTRRAAIGRGHAGSARDPCSTYRMGPGSDPMVVTDPAGRLPGLARLRVAGVSLMPSIPSSNIDAVVTIMAEELADAGIGRTRAPREALPNRSASSANPRVKVGTGER